MNENQRNFNRNEFDSHNKPNRETCWICKPCRCGFPPEIKWDCEDDKHDKKCDKEKDFDDKYDKDECDFGFEKDFCECEKKDKDDKDKDDKDCDKNNGHNNNHRPCCRCQRRCNCCGCFRIFRC